MAQFKNNGKLKLLIIVGTRPEIIRLAAVINKCREYFDCLLAHTGQNYDYNLNERFMTKTPYGNLLMKHVPNMTHEELKKEKVIADKKWLELSKKHKENPDNEEIENEYELNTGKVIVECFKDKDYKAVPAVLAMSHGPFIWGATPEKAVENAIILEEVAKMAVISEAVDPNIKDVDEYLLKKHYERKHGKNAYYGQKGK